MAVKAFFIVPFILGVILALVIGISSDWSTDLWALALIMGTILGVSLGLAARRLKSDMPIQGKWGGDVPPRQKMAVEVTLFIGLLAGIAMPISGKRGILIGEQQVATRSILIAGAVLMGINLILKLLRYGRKR